jgi:hypothetical protein
VFAAFVPCIPVISLLTATVGGVCDPFTWEQGEGIPGGHTSLGTHDFMSHVLVTKILCQNPPRWLLVGRAGFDIYRIAANS